MLECNNSGIIYKLYYKMRYSLSVTPWGCGVGVSWFSGVNASVGGMKSVVDISLFEGM